MALVRCPTCEATFDSLESAAMPFCSDRCRRIDLNRWLSEEIAIPLGEQADEGPANKPADEGDQPD